MRFRFSSPDARGLRLIEEIPDLRFCHLEGRNGIGKTLSVRLLELVAGTQPYRGAPHAWSTLREQLGDTTIVVDGFEGGVVTIHLRPAQWPEEPLPGLADELGSVRLGDRPLPWKRLRELLSVVRIAGDETLTDTLARELEQRSVEASMLARDTEDDVAGWDELLHDLVELTERLDPSRIARLHNEASATKTLEREIASELKRAISQYEETDHLRSLASRAVMRRDKLAGLIDGLSEAVNTLQQADGELARLNQSLHRMAESAARTKQASAEFKKWERLRAYRDRAFSRATVGERQVLRMLGLLHRPSAEELARLTSTARDEHDRTKAELRELDVTGELQELTNELNLVLADAPRAVDDQIVALTTPPVTAAVLRAGVDGRRQELIGIPTPGQIEKLRTQRHQWEQRIVMLGRLKELMEKTDRKQDLLNEANNALAGLLASSKQSGDSTDLLADLRTHQETRVAAALETVAWIQRLTELLGTHPVDPRALLGDDVSATEDDEPDDEYPWAEVDVAQGRIAPPDNPTDPTAWRRLGEALDREAADSLREAFPELADAIIAPEPAQTRVRAAIDRLDVLLGQQAEGVRQLRSEREDARLTAAEARASRDDAVRRLTAARAELDDANGRWSEFRPGLELLAGTQPEYASGAEFEEVDEAIIADAAYVSRVAELVNTIRDSAGSVRDGLFSVSFILLTEASQLSPRVAAAAGELPLQEATIEIAGRKRVRSWAEAELANVIGVSTLRAELFDNADAVSVDLVNARISWRTPDDSRPRLRPLEAFSSGEQVFAYTRARLDLLAAEQPRARHRVVVLDEFGAFVARDRFGQLLEFVRDQALGIVADQVVVMLPLARDYLTPDAASQPDRPGPATAGLGAVDRIAQISQRDYFAVSADPVGA